MNNQTFRKTFNFGKVAYYPTTRKENSVDVEISLKKLDNGEFEFTACGEIWNCRHTHALCGGQCLDTIHEYLHENKVFNEIYDLWKNLHLNGLKAGTRRQEKIVDDYFKKSGKRYDYDEAVEVLKKHGLYIDKLGDGEVLNCVDEERNITPEHYPYGCGWITYTIKSKDLDRIHALFEEGV